jgi:putative transposase
MGRYDPGTLGIGGGNGVPDTYTQLRYHIVFATKYRMPLIGAELREDLYDYLGGTLRGYGGVPLAIGGMPDHVHLLAGWGTTLSVAEVLKKLKGGSSHWINQRPDAPVEGFAWQEGYSAFTVSASQIEAVRRYILRQEEHHKKVTFEDELRDLLTKHGIAFNPQDLAEPHHPLRSRRDHRG